MEKYEYNEKKLDDIGIAFCSPEETRAFVCIVQEEMEFRIGEAIAKEVSKEGLAEFERCKSTKEARLVLKRICPDFEEKIKKVKKELEEELIRYKDWIPGNIKENVSDILQ